ncbi:MAG: Fe-Mn family superoxide dismutase [Cyclobacteriaceae bacterium]|jgi:Fe-Mn family superoxide dismutase
MQTTEKHLLRFELSPFVFEKADFEPYISIKTIKVHYGKHHQGFINKLNKGLTETWLTDAFIEDILNDVSKCRDTIRNYGGGHYNHSFFRKSLSSGWGEPFGKLLDEIKKLFQSFEVLKEWLKNAATGPVGFGWVWLIYNEYNQLEIGSTPNQDNPLMDISESKGYPLIGLDIWKHACCLEYQNKREDYLNAFWNVVD